MADPREVFPTLEDPTTGEGETLAPLQSGESPSSKNGSIGFAFRDSTGNVILPQLNSEGAVPVSSDPGTTSRERGAVASGAQTVGVRSLIAEATLTLGEVYTKMNALCSCRRDALFELVHVDDVGVGDTETILLDGIAGAGQYTVPLGLLIDVFNTTGGTGTQKFILYGTPLQKESDMRGSFSYNQVAS